MQTFSGLDYCKIDVANSFGHDKLDWVDRIAWTDAHLDDLETLEKQAESPAMFYASTKALRAAQRKEPSGYPISLDATASGMQILSALTGCAKTAQHVNLVSTGHREDPYTNLYKVMVDRLGAAAKIERTDTKKAIN
jgi:DNA-directed RNA polymerase